MKNSAHKFSITLAKTILHLLIGGRHAWRPYSKSSRILLLILLLFSFVGCTPQLPNAIEINPLTAVPTLDTSHLCDAGLDTTQSWESRLAALERLAFQAADCTLDVDLQFYVTYVEYGRWLEENNTAQAAIDAYETAMQYYPEGTQAQLALSRLMPERDAEATEASSSCEDNTELSDYQPTSGQFVSIDRTGFQLNGAPYPIYGVTYYPSETPFAQFLTETSLDAVETEFEIIQSAGINTLRMFLRPDDLFLCEAVPNLETFERLEGIMDLAASYDLRIIAVLNADVIPSELYNNPTIMAQMQFIVERYRDEPTILAWDIRDQGDVDYRNGFVRQDIALRWIADSVILIRTVDNNHPVTAGFWQESLLTAPLVDFVSFQFYGDYADLRQEIANLRTGANRPILLTGIGYSTFSVSDVTQRNLLFQAFEEVANNSLAGWVVNHAFNYPRTVTCIPPDCPGNGSDINEYGLWNTAYFPKLAVEAVRLATGVDDE